MSICWIRTSILEIVLLGFVFIGAILRSRGAFWGAVGGGHGPPPECRKVASRNEKQQSAYKIHRSRVCLSVIELAEGFVAIVRALNSRGPP